MQSLTSQRKLEKRSPPRTKRGAFALGLLASLLITNGHAASAAGIPPETNSPERRVQAQGKYQQGVEAYRTEHYADAARLFLEADALLPSAALSYNIARAYEKLSDDAQTLRWYRNYLRLNPQANNAAEVRHYVQALSAALALKGIQQVTVLSTPAGATVAIDGNPLGVTPLTVELRPGAHSALFTLRGYADASNDFTLSAETPVDLALALQPAAEPKSVAGGRRFGAAPWLTLGAAAVCLGGAAIFETSRRSAQNAARTEPVQLDYERDINRMNSRQTAARVLLGVGGALAITGATLLVFNTRRTPESRVFVSGVPGGAALSLERNF